MCSLHLYVEAYVHGFVMLPLPPPPTLPIPEAVNGSVMCVVGSDVEM